MMITMVMCSWQVFAYGLLPLSSLSTILCYGAVQTRNIVHISIVLYRITRRVGIASLQKYVEVSNLMKTFLCLHSQAHSDFFFGGGGITFYTLKDCLQRVWNPHSAWINSGEQIKWGCACTHQDAGKPRTSWPSDPKFRENLSEKMK